MSGSRSAKVLILSSGQVLTAVVSLVSAAVLARVFSKTDYATYRQTLLCYAFAAPFVTLGMDRALYYFLPGERRRPGAILVENLFLLTTAGILLSAFLLAGGNRLLAMRFNNPALAAPLLLLAPYPVLMLPAGSLAACLMARDRTRQVAGFNVTSRLILFVGIVLPCVIWPAPSVAILGTVLGATLTTGIALMLMCRACTGGDWRPTWQGVRRQVLFSVPLGVASVVGSVTGRMDQILVSLRCDPATFAQYSVGAFEIPLIGIVTSSIASVVVVDYATLYREGRYAEIVALIHRVMIRSSLLLMPAMFFLFSVAPDLMTVVFGQQYEASSSVFRVYLLLLPMRTLTYGALLQASGRSRHILYQALSEIVIGAIVGWMAISVAGALGAAIALILVGYFTCIPYYLCVLRSALACPVRRLFPWQELLHVTALSGVGVLGVMAANYLLPMPPPVVRLAVDAMVYWCLTLAGFHLAGWTALFRPTEYLYSLLGIDRSPRPNETSSLP